MQVINHINISLFTPALLFSKVAFFLSPGAPYILPISKILTSLMCPTAKLKELWIIPIFFMVVTIFSALVARVLSGMFGLKTSHRCVSSFTLPDLSLRSHVYCFYNNQS
jgi:predicted permease